jgi:hypothetical protein
VNSIKAKKAELKKRVISSSEEKKMAKPIVGNWSST